MKIYSLYSFIRSTPKKFNIESHNLKDRKHHTQYSVENIYADGASCHNMTSSTKRRIFKKIQRDAKVRECIENIHYYSDLVYGNPGILNKKLVDIIENPKQGKDFLLDIVGDPTSISNLAGREIFCIKSRARKRAEENIKPLCDAIEMFVGVVYALRRQIIHDQTQQKGFDDWKELERKAIQNICRTKEKHLVQKKNIFLLYRQNPSYEIKNESVAFAT